MSNPMANIGASNQDPQNGSNIERMVVEKIEERLVPLVQEEVSRDGERRYRQYRWFAAFIGAIGLGTFGTLANYLIEKAVESRIEAKAGNISESIDYMRFYTMTLKLDLGTSYSTDEKDIVMTYLRSSSKNDRVRHSKEFLAGLTRIAKAFASSNQSAALDEVFALYEKEVLASPVIVESFLHHYGQDIASRVAEPKQDTSYLTFEKLERAAASKLGELALYYRTLYSYHKSAMKPNSETDALVRRMSMYSGDDLSNLLAQMFQRTRAENWQRTPTTEGREIEKLLRHLFRDYGATLASTLKLPEEVFVVAANEGIEKDKVERLAAALASKSSQRN